MYNVRCLQKQTVGEGFIGILSSLSDFSRNLKLFHNNNIGMACLLNYSPRHHDASSTCVKLGIEGHFQEQQRQKTEPVTLRASFDSLLNFH